MHSSLYKVKRMRFEGSSILWKELKKRTAEEDRVAGVSVAHNEIVNQYIWGVELISGFNERRANISMLEITQEITYLQSRCFSKFITDIVDKLHNKGMPLDNCQKDILEMVLNNFNTKFSQRHFDF